MSAIAVSIRGLRKSFARGLARCARRTVAIADIDLDLYRSQIVGLVGDEGAGKTTLLQCACGLLRPDSGCVTAGDGHRDRSVSSAVAYVPAVPVYYPFLTVRDAVSLRASRLLARSAPTIEQTLDLLELSHLRNDIIAALSPSELMRLSIAEAISANPVALMIDTSGSSSLLDQYPVQRAFRRVASSGTAVMIAARQRRAVAPVSHRVVELREGTVVTEAGESLIVAERLH